MSASRARRVLLAAIAVSLLIHLIFAGYFRWPQLDRANTQSEIIKVRRLQIAKIVPTPPPTPVPTPVSTPAVHASIAPPVVHTQKGPGPPVRHVTAGPPSPAAVATAAPSPVPVATRAGACVASNAEPTVAATPDVPDIPAAARASKTSGTTAISVSLDEQARVTNASVAQSSGNAGLDGVALAMARDATYTPKYQACKPVPGTYTFTVKFAAW